MDIFELRCAITATILYSLNSYITSRLIIRVFLIPGNFDWRFRGGEGPITANLPGKYNLREFSFCMWLKSNLSKATSSSVFTVKSGFYTIMKFLLKSDNDCDFTLNSQTRYVSFFLMVVFPARIYWLCEYYNNKWLFCLHLKPIYCSIWLQSLW